jgi:hypothetical protein
MLLLGILSACVAGNQTVAVSQQIVPADPVLAFAASGSVGQTEAVAQRSGGLPVDVTIDSQYNSAAGELCRTYTITSSGGPSQQVACTDGTNWRTIPPLLNSNH